jgi:hypothetical protein
MAVEQVDDGVGLLGAIPLGSYYGNEDVLIHTIAPDGNLLLLIGMGVGSMKGYKQKDGK